MGGRGLFIAKKRVCQKCKLFFDVHLEATHGYQRPWIVFEISKNTFGSLSRIDCLCRFQKDGRRLRKIVFDKIAFDIYGNASARAFGEDKIILDVHKNPHIGFAENATLSPILTTTCGRFVKGSKFFDGCKTEDLLKK